MLHRVPGTQDLLDLKLYNAVTTIIRDQLTRASFHEIMTPLIEPTELFQRSLGQETDIMSKELYLVSSHHTPEAERAELCLRPEATASTMRAYLNNNVAARPWNAFTIGPMFRHERQQKGRYRQFTQANLESIGSQSVAQDVHIITLLERLFQERFKLCDYALLINYMGCLDDRQRYAEILRAFLTDKKSEICGTCLQRSEKNLLRVFDCKQEGCRTLYAGAPQIAEHLCMSCTDEWSLLRALLGQLSVSYTYAPLLVRGLDYYEKTVFEFVSMELGAQNTFCGGGRYNRLAVELGARENIPAIGAAIGIERLLLLVGESLGATLTERPLHLIAPLSSEQWPLAMQIVDLLRQEPYEVEPLLEGDSVKSMLRQGNKRGARTVLIIGPDEQQAGVVGVKQLRTGVEEKVKQVRLVEYLRNII